MEDRKLNIIRVFAGLLCLNLIATLDMTALSVCIPTIATDLKATSIQAYWTGTAFVLASAVFQPVISALSLPFGHRPVIISCLILFAVGTVVCATAQHVSILLIGRTLQGIGGGGMLTMTYVVMTALLTLRERVTAISALAVAWMLGTCTGPVMGGGFTTHVSWRWIFWIVLPLAGLGLVLITFYMRTPHDPTNSATKFKEVDWVGSVLFVASLTSFLMAISWGGTQYDWNQYQTLVPLILGAAGISWWLMYERYVPKRPMLPLEILKNRTTAVAFIGTLLMGIVQFSLLYFLPLYYEASKGYSPLIAGVALLPNCVGNFITAVSLSRYILRTEHYNIVIRAGWILLTLGSGILVLLDSHTSVPAWIFMNVVSGLGFGCQYASLSIASQAPQTRENLPIASGLTPFFRAIGYAFGIAISDAIYQNKLKSYLLDASSSFLRSRAADLARDSASIVEFLHHLPPGSEDRIELLSAFNKSLHAIWWAMMGISIFAGALALFMEECSLDGLLSDDPVSAPSDPESGIKSEEGTGEGVTENEAHETTMGSNQA